MSKHNHKTVIYFSNTDWYLYNFRRELIDGATKNLDSRPVAFVPDGKYCSELARMGMQVEKAKMDQGGINPLKDLVLFLQTLTVFMRTAPALVHLFTIKCVLYGGVAARLLGIPRVCAVTGLGHLFICNSLKTRVIRKIIGPFYRFALGGKRVSVVFQNEEDRQAYIEMGFVKSPVTSLIRGSGVNLEKFSSLPPAENELPTFLYVGRLLKEKGVHDLLEAAKLLNAKRFKFRLRLAGDFYEGNPSSLSRDYVDTFKDCDFVEFLGHVNDIRQEIAGADVVVLPSYREGTPKSLLEAAASSRAILCSNIAGNRGVVQPDINGYYFEAGDVETIADAMEMMISSPETIQRYAQASRAVVSGAFSTEVVVRETLGIYRRLLETKTLLGTPTVDGARTLSDLPKPRQI